VYLHIANQNKGMPPLAVVILLKIVANQNEAWFARDLAAEMYISQSEVRGV